MNHLVFGSNTAAVADLGELIHSGQDGDAAEKAIADNRDKYAVIRRTLPGFEAYLRTVQQYDPNHRAVKKDEPESAPLEKAPVDEPEPASEEKAPVEQVTPESKPKGHKHHPKK